MPRPRSIRRRQRRLRRLRSRLSPKHRRRNQRDNQPNRKRLDERHGRVKQRVGIHLLIFLHLLNFRLNRCSTRARFLELLDHTSPIFVHEVRQKVVIENFPGHHIADARNQSDGNPHSKAFEKVICPLPTLPRYERIPKNTSKNESTIDV